VTFLRPKWQNSYDILLSDVNEKILREDISKALGNSYLSQTPPLLAPIDNIT
jgi:hypothetical protein